MSNLTMLNDIALLPKSIEYCEETFMFNTWITFKGKLCIGYKHVSTHDSLISIIVGDNISYGTYLNIIRLNGKEKEIETIIAETAKIEEAFNKLYQILIRGLYKLK
jgi:hypothetical protein